jgi:DNA topoisomerase-1
MAPAFEWPADVTYSDSANLPIRRLRCGRGFSYRDATDAVVRDKRVRLRIDALAIPPAWENVRIAAYATWHMQAVGRDARGRRQYRYHPLWIERNKLRDFDRLVDFSAKLPVIRRYIDRQLRRRQLDKDQVIGIALHLLDRTLIRVGNTAYAADNNTYGLTTLRDRHVKISGDSIRFTFTGKGGQERRLEFDDPRAARALRQCHELPGQQLLQYVADDGELRSLTSTDINDALLQITGQPFTAKTFRTWGASSDAYERLVHTEPPTSVSDGMRKLNAALRDTAAILGNTLAVCRKHYVHPAIGEAFLADALPASLGPSRKGLSEAESALARFLE